MARPKITTELTSRGTPRKRAYAADKKLPAYQRDNGLQNLAPGDTSKYLQNVYNLAHLPKIDHKDVDAVAARIDWYFENQIASDLRPTVNGLALALGVDRNTFMQWLNDNQRPYLRDEAKRAHVILTTLWEDYMQNGKINPVSGIFLGKNHFGYKDKQDVEITTGDAVRDGKTEEELRNIYDAPIETDAEIVE